MNAAYLAPMVASLVAGGCVSGAGKFYTPGDWPTPDVVLVDKVPSVVFHHHTGVLVHIDAEEPLALQMEHEGWTVVCVAPCDEWVRAGKKYRVARLDWADEDGLPPRFSDGLPVTHPFHLEVPDGSWARIEVYGRTPPPPGQPPPGPPHPRVGP